LPNKYTKKKELYVFEFGKNLSNLPDSFCGQTLSTMPTLIKFDTRIHGHYGGAIWIMPLLNKLDRQEEFILQESIFNIWEEHLFSLRKNENEDRIGTDCKTIIPPFSFPDNHMEWADQWGYKNLLRRSVAEFMGAAAVSIALASCGRVIKSQGYVSILDIIKVFL